MELPDSRKV